MKRPIRTPPVRCGSGGRKAFTLIELLAVIAIIAIVAAVLFPVFARARSRAVQSACLSNMGQIARAVQMYMSDHRSRVPVCRDDIPESGGYWWVVLHPYTKADDVFVCPGWTPTPLPSGLLDWERPPVPSEPFERAGIRGTYVWNETLDGAPESGFSGTAADGLVFGPSRIIVVSEGFNGSHVWKPEHVAPGRPEERLRYQHDGSANAAYLDGHARHIRRDGMKPSLWAPWDHNLWRP